MYQSKFLQNFDTDRKYRPPLTITCTCQGELEVHVHVMQ